VNSNKPLLLLIEDDPQFRLLLSTTLQSSDYQVMALATGRDGLSAARSEKPSLLILDRLPRSSKKKPDRFGHGGRVEMPLCWRSCSIHPCIQETPSLIVLQVL